MRKYQFGNATICPEDGIALAKMLWVYGEKIQAIKLMRRFGKDGTDIGLKDTRDFCEGGFVVEADLKVGDTYQSNSGRFFEVVGISGKNYWLVDKNNDFVTRHEDDL